MLALTPSERRGALVVVLLLLIGAGHDLWRARGESLAPPRGPAQELDGAGLDAPPGGPVARSAMPVPEPRLGAGSSVARDSAAMEMAPALRNAAARRAPIDLNRAGAGDLDGLPGIGPVLAGRIVLQRRRFGPFRQVDELLAVRGVGPRLLERIRPWATVQSPPDPGHPAAGASPDTMAKSRR